MHGASTNAPVGLAHAAPIKKGIGQRFVRSKDPWFHPGAAN